MNLPEKYAERMKNMLGEDYDKYLKTRGVKNEIYGF